MKEDREIISATLKKRGGAFKHIPGWAKKERKYVKMAARRNGSTIEYAPKDLRTEESVLKIAVERDPRAVLSGTPSCAQTKDVAVAAMMKNFQAFRYLSHDLKQDDDVRAAATNSLLFN